MENKFGELIRDKMSGHIAPIIGINKHGFVAATKHNSGLHRFLPEEEGIQFEFIGEKDIKDAIRQAAEKISYELDCCIASAVDGEISQDVFLSNVNFILDQYVKPLLEKDNQWVQ